ncbi:MAG: DUF3149 domain-containing protein [Betaproteobacteria bacterium]|nr:DUF3149 domain-containing protein [Betaproteobacteria bacterium]MCL2885625.1 DUF3149 domain-containing protein [Betaproteobacteria bacterium]
MAWKELLTTDIGLMSLAVIVGVVVIAAVLGKIFLNKINEETSKLGN